MNTKELPKLSELLDNNLPSHEPNEVTVTLTTDEDTLRAMELLFSPNLSELKENQPEMFQYYSLFGAAEGIMRSANLMLYAAPDNPELAKSLMAIAKVIAKTGAEMFEDAERPNLQNYLRRIVHFVNGFIQAPMANTNAAVIYGFNVLNNKFIENGFVFSEQNRSLKYIDIMDRAEELESQEPNGPELSEELMKDLEKYIEYRNILDRTYFIWNLKEELLDKLKELAKYQAQSATSIHLININKQDKTHSFKLERNVLSFIDENEHEQVLDLDFKKETSAETDLILHNELKEVFEREFEDEQGLNRKYSEFIDSIDILFNEEESIETQTETQTIQEANATILNFCTILTIFLIKITEHHRKKEMDQLVKEFTTKVNTLNMTL